MGKKFNLLEYDDRYYKWHFDRTKPYILKTMNWYIQTYKPKSVIDYGCGIGAYLESALSNGITTLKGFDIGGELVRKYTEKSIQPYIEYLDCTRVLKTEKYDCAISLETGEHLESINADQFVLNIVNSTKKTGTIIYSAAPPGQGGTGHINCQPKQYWIEKFLVNSFIYNESLTNNIKLNWKKIITPHYIINNLIIFQHKSYIK